MKVVIDAFFDHENSTTPEMYEKINVSAFDKYSSTCNRVAFDFKIDGNSIGSIKPDDEGYINLRLVLNSYELLRAIRALQL